MVVVFENLQIRKKQEAKRQSRMEQGKSWNYDIQGVTDKVGNLREGDKIRQIVHNNVCPKILRLQDTGC